MKRKNFSDALDQWKRIICGYLGRKMSHKVSNIALDILCVDIGLKPGFLFDYGTLTVEQMELLLHSLNKENLTSSKNLCAIGVDTDVIVVNPVCLRQYLNFVKTCGSFIDVSVKNELPCLADESKGQIIPSLTTVDMIYRDLRSNVASGRPYMAHILSTANVSTIYGLLLGYPVIYWYEHSANEDIGQCLSMEPLRNFKVWGSLLPNTWSPGTSQSVHSKGHHSADKHLVYSFTVPECFMDDVKGKIDDWMKMVCTLSCWKEVFTDLYCTQDIITEPTVVL